MIKFTKLQESEFEEWLHLCVNSFNHNIFSEMLYNYFKNHFINDPNHNFNDIYIAKDHEKIIASLRIFKREMYIEGIKVPFAGIGEVCTKREYRHQGISSKLIEMALEDQKQAGYIFAYLGSGIPDFYRRFGFESTTYRYNRILIHQRDIHENYEVRKISGNEIRQIYDTFSSKLNGPIVRDDFYLSHWTTTELRNPHGLYKDGQLVAYLDYGEKDGGLIIREYGELGEYFDDFISLIKLRTSLILVPDVINTSHLILEKVERRGRMVILLNKFEKQDLKFNLTSDILEKLNHNYTFWRTDYF